MHQRSLAPAAPRALGAAALLACAAWAHVAAAATAVPITGEIQSITIDDPADHWSGGRIVVGGQSVILPRNLLLDLPANRLTLKQLFAEAPPACVAAGQTGLAKTDSCNTTGTGGFATITANRTNAGNVIAGDAFISKGLEAVVGAVTYIDHASGYFRLNGAPNDPATGVMVRLNDPDARHTIQQGPGCAAVDATTGRVASNCSPDPRFTLDGDNYTNVFGTGYPLCIPSTVDRPFRGLPAASGIAALPAGTARANADGTGDVLCPATNRTVNNGQPVEDSRRFAPIRLGDSITAEGNFETIGGVRFLSAHTTMVGAALSTKNAPDMPDYLFLDEVEIDTGGLQNQRIRSLFIGYATVAPTDILIHSIHYDPATNSPHLFPLASAIGCDLAGGPGTCTAQGLVGAGANIFKIRHDVDFLVGAKPRLNPCAHLAADPRLASSNICPSGALVETNSREMFGILSPIPHEIQAYTGHRLANGAAWITLDVSGSDATSGQYLFPFGVGLGGVAFPEMNEINLADLAFPFMFTALPWTLDRRLSPAGCIDTNGDGVVDCESTPQPLDPYPFEGIDPRNQASIPLGTYADPNYTASPLSRTANRILSYVDPATGKFNGNATVLAWPPVDPAYRPIVETPLVGMVCAAGTAGNSPPVANADSASTLGGTAVRIAVLANDSDPEGDPLAITAVTDGAQGTVSTDGAAVVYTPAAGFTGTDSFNYTVTDGVGGSATAAVSVQVVTNRPPVASADGVSTPSGTRVTIAVLANDSDPDGDPLTLAGIGAATNGSTARNAANSSAIDYTPAPGFAGTDSFSYTVSDGRGATSIGTVTVVVLPAQQLTVGTARFRTGNSEWRLAGTTDAPDGTQVTVYFGPTADGTGPVIGQAGALAGAWSIRVTGSTIRAAPGDVVSARTSGGATVLGVPVNVTR